MDVFTIDQYCIRTMDLVILHSDAISPTIEKHHTRVLSKTTYIVRNHLNLAAAIEHREWNQFNFKFWQFAADGSCVSMALPGAGPTAGGGRLSAGYSDTISPGSAPEA